MRVRVHGGVPLRGRAALPVDPAVAQRALAVAALCSHPTRIDERIEGSGPLSMLQVLRSLGVSIEHEVESTRIAGVGRTGLTAPAGALDAGTSPLAFAITVGLLSAQRFGTRVLLETTAESPAPAIAAALRARGAMIAEGNVQAPGAHGRKRTSLAVAPLVDDEALRSLEHVLPVPNELVKTALLFSGLYAAGETNIGEPLLSADHTERWLTAAGVPVRRLGSMAGIDPAEWTGELAFASAPLNARDERVLKLPGDTALASLLACVASLVPGSSVLLENVGWNATRIGVLEALRLSGARIQATSHGDGAGHEPVAEARIEPARLRGGPIDGELLVRAGSAAPLLAMLGACSARGGSLHDAAFCPELQPAPWPLIAGALRAFGANARHHADQSLRIEPAAALAPGHCDALGSPALGLLALALALVADGQSVLEGMPALDDQWPGLLGVLTQLGARIEVET
jgi:3-phosphoshikimate 1-carboxyvinyltransferase